jgi:hypothetical protein
MKPAGAGNPPPVRFRAAVAMAIMLAACVGSSRSDADYTSKAGATIAQVRSSVETVAVAVHVMRSDGAFDPYLSRLIGQAEEDASAAVDSFDVVQPPSPTADRLRADLHGATDGAVDALTAARVAIRRGDDAAVIALAGDLQQAADRLDAFEKAHP